MLQGGFSLSPEHAGFLVTPLAACVAVGSILNSRIVTRLNNPTLVLSAGFSLLSLSAVALALVRKDTPHILLEGALLAGGIGMGFIFSNLNVFAQELVGRGRFGITTAVIQSTRMIGGMLGTALIGMLVTRTYSLFVPNALARWRTQLPSSVLKLVQDPQLLVNRRSEIDLLSKCAQLGIDGDLLVAVLRRTLVTSIHFGFLLTALIALFAVCKVRRISHIRFANSARSIQKTR